MHEVFPTLPDPKCSDLIDMLRRHAEQSPDQRVFSYLARGGEVEEEVSYRDLDRRARAIAAALQERGVAGGRVLLLCPPGIEYIAAFLGCCYGGGVPVPSYPPLNERQAVRLCRIVEASEATVVLGTGSILAGARLMRTQTRMKRWVERIPGFGKRTRDAGPLAAFDGLEWIALDDLQHADPAAWRPPAVAPQDVAFLQYTSGSTGEPKGVMVTHANLIANMSASGRFFGMRPGIKTVSWLPPYHDMGLIGQILASLYLGLHTYLMSPMTFLQRPLGWLHAISRVRAEVSGGPNFAYDLCARKARPEDLEELDLSCWRAAFNGAEPVRAATLERFAAVFERCGFRKAAFYPCYGLAENTLIVSGGDPAAEPVVGTFGGSAGDGQPDAPVEPPRQLVSSGRMAAPQVPGQRILIVDPETLHRCPAGQVGEIWVSGPSVAAGYWGQPEATRETFQAYTRDSGEGPFLRTGDLGFEHEGELYVKGRLKNIIILRGRNVYAEDVEVTAARAHASLRPGCTAAFAVESDGTEGLVVVQEVHRRVTESPEALAAAIRAAIAEELGIEAQAVVLVRTRKIPKTTSGKIRRQACRAAYLEGRLDEIGRFLLPEEPRSEGEGVGDRPAAEPAPAGAEEAVRSAAEIGSWLARWIAQRAGIEARSIPPEATLSDYGLGSLDAVRLMGDLEELLGRALSPTLAYDYPTLESLARHLAQERPAAETARPRGRRSSAEHEPIAIVGMACRFPGAATPAELWELLRSGTDAVSTVPPGRWEESEALRAAGDAVRSGGFLECLDLFDHELFGIAPREAAGMDPQQRLLLEVAWEAFENAAQPPSKLTGSRTGVYVGVSAGEYAHLVSRGGRPLDGHFGTGTAASIVANRLSYLFDLRGPSLAVDTACSSALVAVHLAVQSLRCGECDRALAGGVNLMVLPDLSIVFAKASMLAAGGRCRTFDAAADGYVRGEGCGVVVLRRLRDALADGDRILAQIRGSAVNQDGRTNGLTAPNGPSQRAVIEAALADARLEPAAISYVEAHGTGTPLGDPIELGALAEALRPGRNGGRPCGVGSIKTNIGHLEAAAGVAGLIKTALALQHRELPPHLHLRELNPRIQLDSVPFFIPTELQPWTVEEGLRRAGVSSFGFGGTNCHVVLEEAPVGERTETPASERPVHVLPLSARSPEALVELVERYADFVTGHPEMRLEDLCYTAGVGRQHFATRLAVCGGSAADLEERLRAWVAARRSASGGSVEGSPAPPPAQDPVESLAVRYERGEDVDWSAHYRDRGARPLELPTYPFQRSRHWVADPAAGSAPTVVAETDLGGDPALARRVEELCASFGDDGLWAVNRRTTAPLLFIAPGRQGLFYCNRRGRALLAFSWAGPAEAYAPAVRALQAYARAEGLTPTVLADETRLGTLEDLELRGTEIGLWQNLGDLSEFSLEGGRMRRLRSKVHSYLNGGQASCTEHRPGEDPAVDRAVVELIDRWIERKRRRVPFAPRLKRDILEGSLGRGHRLFLTRRDGHLDAAILLSPIPPRDGYLMDLEFYPPGMPSGCLEFGIVEILRQLRAEGVRYFSLGSTFGTEPEATSPGDPQLAELLNGLRRQGLLDGEANLAFKSKFHPSARRIYLFRPVGGAASELADVIGMLASPGSPGREGGDSGPHPLLGRRLPLAFEPAVFETQLDLEREELRFLSDHRIEGEVWLPAAAYLESALAGARALFGEGARTLRDVELLAALMPAAAAHRLQVSFTRCDGGARFDVYSAPDGAAARGPEAWTHHARGVVVSSEGASGPPAETSEEAGRAAVLSRCPKVLSPAAHFDRVGRLGLELGRDFRRIVRLQRGENEAIAQVVAPEATPAGAFHVHPALLDACLQVLGAALLRPEEEAVQDDAPQEALFLPLRLGRVRLSRAPVGEVWAHARVSPPSAAAPATAGGAVRVFDAAGETLVEIDDILLKRVPPRADLARRAGVPVELYQIEWRPTPSDTATPGVETDGHWLIFDDGCGTGTELAELFEGRGAASFVVLPGDSYERPAPGVWRIDPRQPDHVSRVLRDAAAAAAGRPCRGIVHMWGGRESAAASTATLAAAHRLACESALHLVRELVARNATTGGPRLWLVTRGVQALGTPGFSGLIGAPLWGLGRTLAQEHPELWGGLIDLPGSGAAPAEALLAELGNPQGEDNIAWRDTERYAARLVRVAERGSVAEIRFRDDATYLITGGLGALGRRLAHWMAQRGARHLALLGRTPADAPRALETVDALAAAGAAAVVLQADVAEAGALADALARIEAELPELRGVIHAAGTLADGALVRQSWEQLETVFDPKVLGAWNLHELTRERPLDHFVMFSSVASVLGSAGQASYAAANAFLDTLAHLRRGRGLPALSVNWGPWAGEGMAAAGAAQRAERGLEDLGSEAALAAFASALGQPDLAQCGILAVDWRRLLAAAPAALGRCSLTRELAPRPAPSAALQSRPPAPARDVERLIEELCERAAEVMLLPSGKVGTDTPLTELGLDSLMALELRERVAADWGVDIPVESLFRGDTIADLARQIAGGADGGAPGAEEGAIASSAAATAAGVDLWAESELGFDLEIPPGEPVAARPTEILLTGASGFVGAFVLRELLERTKARVSCLVRAGDDAEARSRLEENLRSYMLWEGLDTSRIVPVAGDLARERFGLPEHRYAELARRCDTVYHLAANTNLAATYATLRPGNVLGTREVLRFATQERLKLLHHLSSYGPFDSTENIDQVITEQDEPLQPAGLSNGYCETKWVAERLVRNARAAGLPVCIYRVGWVSGHSRTGAWSRTDFIPRLLQICVELKKICHLGARTMTPVDDLARALVILSLRPDCVGETFHLSNGERYASDELFGWARSFGYELEEVSFEEWEEEVRTRGRSLASELILMVLEDTRQRRLRFSDWFSREPHVSAAYTLGRLEEHGVAEPVVDERLLHTYLDYFVATGHLAPPSRGVPATGAATGGEVAVKVSRPVAE